MVAGCETVGFIGLGAMGLPMAANLIKKLPQLAQIFIFDISPKPVEQLCALDRSRVLACASCREVAEKSDIIFSIVPEGIHARAVYLSPESGVLSAPLGAKILVDCSTIDTETSLDIAAHVKEQYPEASFYDAPVSGGALGAEAGTLTFMLGCAKEDPNYPRLLELIGTMGTNIIACGKPSLGLVAKLCNNYCSGLIAIATAEAMDIGIRSGIDPRTLKDIFSTSTAQSTILDKFCPVPGIVMSAPSSHGYQGGFKVQLMRKDFALACQAAESVGAKPTLAKAGLDTYTAAANDPRCADLDSRVVFRYLGGDENWKSKFLN